jgi:hypothetical protein
MFWCVEYLSRWPFLLIYGSIERTTTLSNGNNDEKKRKRKRSKYDESLVKSGGALFLTIFFELAN